MGDIKIFAKTVEDTALEQIRQLDKYNMGGHIRIMPDVHAGKGCTIGTTMRIDINRICPNLIGVDIGCLDSETEYLTKEGWKKMGDYTGGEIFVYNEKTDDGYFDLPLAHIEKECDSFYHYKNSKGLDQMVSEEHKMLVYSGYKSKGYSIKTMSPAELNQKSLEKGYYVFKTTFHNSNEGLGYTAERVQLEVMVSADGRIKELKNEDFNTVEFHFKKERKIKRCQEILTANNIQYNKYHGSNEDTFISCRISKEINKDLTKFFCGNMLELKTLAEESLKWDGVEGYRSYYSSTIPVNSDVVQYAFASTGIRAGISYPSHQEGHNQVYVVTPTRNEYVGYNVKGEKVPSKDGKKYCFTSPTGFFLARRNGKMFLTGNCGVLYCQYEKSGNIDLADLDARLRQIIPLGFNIHQDSEVSHRNKEYVTYLFNRMYCAKDLPKGILERAIQSIGTLGGGNHYIEAYDLGDYIGFSIHTGSRNLGKVVAEYYQSLAIETCQEDVPKDLKFLTGELGRQYLHDMTICQEYSYLNRETIAVNIEIEFDLHELVHEISSIHNFIDASGVLRKGAISAKEGEFVVIPLNMRDGIILGIGMGNEDWNCSAPHGAGRLYSRGNAKRTFKIEDFKETMEGIYTTSVREDTIDESPFAYKDAQEIIEAIGDTVDIVKVLKPCYNLKA